MPSLRFESATAVDALSDLEFNIIPEGGAVVNLWGSGATAGDSFAFKIGNKEICPAGSEMNIEVAADVVDVSRDHLVMDEWVPPGQLRLPIDATGDTQWLLTIRYMRPQP